MMFHNLHIIDVAIIICYLAVCLIIGFLTSKKVKNIRDYAIGSGHISTAVLVGTFFATDIGAGATVGAIDKMQKVGLAFILAFLLRPMCWLVASFIFSKNIHKFKEMGCISISDIMEALYGKPGRWICNIVSLCSALGILTLQVTAISGLFQYFLGASSTYCALIAFTILVLYSLMGGIRAVAITDLMQASIFLIGIPLACFLAIDSLGFSFETVLEKLPADYKSPTISLSNTSLFFSIFIISMTANIDVPFIQRYLMANNELQLRKAMYDCFYMSVPFAIILVIAGLIIKVSPNADTKHALYYFINTHLPIGLKGFVVAGMLAVIMSTADSWLNTASLLFTHDILGKLFPKLVRNRELYFIKITTILIGSLAVFWAMSHGQNMLDFMWFVDNFWSPIITMPLVVGLFSAKKDTRAILVSCVFAIIGVLIGWYVTGELAKVSTLIGMIGSALGLLGAHYYNRGFAFKAPKLELPVIGWHGILNFSENQVRTHGHNYFLAGGLGIMYFISSIFLYNPHSTSGMLLCVRSISALLCIGLILHERICLGANQQKYLSLYYHIVLMVIFPLISGYIMLLTGFSAFWVVSFLLAIIILNFVCGITMTALLTPLGLLGAHILWKKSGGYVLPVPPSMVHIGFTAILLVITARVRHNFQRSLIEIREMYSTMIAHQVMQPIAQVSMVAEHAASVLAPHVHNEDLQEVAKQLTSLQKIGHKGTELVNGLLMMSRDDIEKAQDRGAYYIQDVINTALLTYSEKQLGRIKIDKSTDFRLNGSKMFMVEVLRNLISNSLKYAGPKAEIEIFCGPRALYIRDNGRGIEKERIPYIFDPTRNSNGQTTGTGFGLSFVKRVVDTFSCSIICRSELGKYTEFVIGFPRL